MEDFEDLAIPLKDGITLKGRRYQSEGDGERGATSSPSVVYRIMCWHGWMDNCRTFWKLAPALVQGLEAFSSNTNQNVTVDLVALDFPGHGQSSHKSLDGPLIVLPEYAYYVHEALQALGWNSESVTMIGHSMGGAVSLMYSAAFPVQELILLDSLGPYVPPSGTASTHLKKHIQGRLRGKDANSVYDSFDQAVEVRMLTATTYPGKQYISKEAAAQLVQGASRILGNEEDGDSSLKAGKLQFLHDQRLKLPSIQYVTQGALEDFYQSVGASSANVCILLAEQGMPFPEDHISKARRLLQAQQLETLPGSHHFHADPDSYAKVAETILGFIQQSRQEQSQEDSTSTRAQASL